MTENRIAGTWRAVEAYAEADGTRSPLYGGSVDGVVIFSPDLWFVETFRDTTLAPFASGNRERGSAEENAAVVAGTLGQYGTYEVDEQGEFVGNTIVGSTFPNWSGLSRATDRLRLTVAGDELTERLADPDAPVITIRYRRAE